MRTCIDALTFVIALAAPVACAHGPQIQITNDNGQIVTRELLLDGPYSTSLTAPKLAYVMPLSEFGGVWYSRPNNAPSTTIPGAPEFPSGPGLAYGYDLVDGGPQAFAEGSVLSVEFADGFKRWNGTTFADAGATELKGFRGSNVNIASPPENFAVSSDVGPFDGVSLSAVAAGYGAEGAEVHNSLRFAMLGDGLSPTSAVPNGIYLAKMRIVSSDRSLLGSNPYFFVLTKNAAMSDVIAAVQSLGVSPERVQWLVPEPGTATLVLLCFTAVFCLGGRVRRHLEQ